MRKNNHYLLILFTILLITGCAKSHGKVTDDTDNMVEKAPLFENMGSHTYKITTRSELAQKYFNQGLNLAYGFNHAEAGRSFRYAALLDPKCAMCYWGAAYVLGPNINSSMDPGSVTQAYTFTQKALIESEKVSEKEKDLIKTLSKRYGTEVIDDRSSYDKAYADAMRQLTRKYPDDAEILSLFAESVMDLHPWDYWTAEGKPQPWTDEILASLESALTINENHPMANHLYIHSVEASPNPQKGVPNADRLGALVPGAGHLVHMPAHIYIRVGRYADASDANIKAMASDESYVSQCHAQGVYPLAYKPHNIHFLWASSTLEGNSAMAMQSAKELAGEVDKQMMVQQGLETLQHFYVSPLYSMIKFGMWDEILKQPLPDESLVYPRGIWNYAMGMAYLRTKDIQSARVHLSNLDKISSDPAMQNMKIWDSNTMADLLKIADHMLRSEISESGGNYNEALRHLYTAKEIEDSLNYDEPHDWFSPVRLTLGDVLIKAGKPEEAEKVYVENLARYPNNGWALMGLYNALVAQNKEKEAQAVKAMFDKAWSNSDIKITASRL